jgi:hypothetical protein
LMIVAVHIAQISCVVVWRLVLSVRVVRWNEYVRKVVTLYARVLLLRHVQRKVQILLYE